MTEVMRWGGVFAFPGEMKTERLGMERFSRPPLEPITVFRAMGIVPPAGVIVRSGWIPDVF